MKSVMCLQNRLLPKKNVFPPKNAANQPLLYQRFTIKFDYLGARKRTTETLAAL